MKTRRRIIIGDGQASNVVDTATIVPSEYLHFEGNDYIETDIIFDNSTAVEYAFYQGRASFYGPYTMSNGTIHTPTIHSLTKVHFFYRLNDDNGSFHVYDMAELNPTFNERHEVKMFVEDNCIKIDGIQLPDGTSDSVQVTGVGLFIGTNPNNPDSRINMFIGEIGPISIYDLKTGKLSHHLLPAAKDNWTGVYDEVTQRFYPSAYNNITSFTST